jgi:hypothetical protein
VVPTYNDTSPLLAMPTGPIDDSGNVLYFEDSGPLDGPYLTVMMLSAVGFNAPGVSKILSVSNFLAKVLCELL